MRVSESRMELAPIMLSVSIFANLLAKIRIKSENKQNEGDFFCDGWISRSTCFTKDGAGRIAILSKSLHRRANDIAKAHTSIWGVGIGGTRQIEKGSQPTICKDTNKIGKQTKRSGIFLRWMVCSFCMFHKKMVSDALPFYQNRYTAARMT